TVDPHPIGRLVCLAAALHDRDGEVRGRALGVLEVVHVAEQQLTALAGVIEMAEVRLTVLEQDGGLALRAEEWQRACVDVARDEHAHRGRHDRPTEPPSDDPYRIATRPHASAHRRSW